MTQQKRPPGARPESSLKDRWWDTLLYAILEHEVRE
jgi:hypothetical protein